MGTSDSIIHSISGGLGIILSTLLLYPLETVRTRLQVEKDHVSSYAFQYIYKIYKKEGMKGIYCGWQAVSLSQFATYCTYFFAFHYFKDTSCEEISVKNQSMCNDLLYGLYAGIAAVLVTNPLWVINTRLKLQGAKCVPNLLKDTKQPPYNGMIDCFFKILKYEGIYSFWNGLLPSLILVCNPSIQFMVYEALKRHHVLIIGEKNLHGFVMLIYGALSKLIATVVTYPLQVVQTRIRAGTIVLPENCQLNSLKTLKQLFKGFESKLIQTGMNAAFMFLFYEKIKIFIVGLMP